MLRLWYYVWASPASFIGLAVGALGLVTGGHVQRERGCLEFYGGFVDWALRRLINNPAAMTLGHTILGRSTEDLAWARDHEHVHVRQYQRWGPFFIPAYLLCSLVLWLRGKNPYFDNPFEVEAFDQFP